MRSIYLITPCALIVYAHYDWNLLLYIYVYVYIYIYIYVFFKLLNGYLTSNISLWLLWYTCTCREVEHHRMIRLPPNYSVNRDGLFIPFCSSITLFPHTFFGLESKFWTILISVLDLHSLSFNNI